MSRLTLSLIQTSLHWQDREANLSHLSALIGTIPQTDLIMLPEMFTTGFSMRPGEFAEHMNGWAMAWMHEKAKQKNAVVCGSVMMKDGGMFYNRLIWMPPDGQFQHYDKRHLFRMGDEHLYYHAGESKLLIQYKGFSIFPVICYDIRFPVWLRRSLKFNYDLMLVVANWPERRNMHWKTLLQARAIENQSYVAAVNRVGPDGNEVAHSGDSMLINAKGEILFHQADSELVKTITIDKAECDEYRAAFPVIEDADSFSIDI